MGCNVESCVVCPTWGHDQCDTRYENLIVYVLVYCIISRKKVAMLQCYILSIHHKQAPLPRLWEYIWSVIKFQGPCSNTSQLHGPPQNPFRWFGYCWESSST